MWNVTMTCCRMSSSQAVDRGRVLTPTILSTLMSPSSSIPIACGISRDIPIFQPQNPLTRHVLFPFPLGKPRERCFWIYTSLIPQYGIDVCSVNEEYRDFILSF